MTDVKRKALSRSRSVKSTVCARTLCAKGRSDNAAAPAEPLGLRCGIVHQGRVKVWRIQIKMVKVGLGLDFN
jgi:hypothetical protein